METRVHRCCHDVAKVHWCEPHSPATDKRYILATSGDCCLPGTPTHGHRLCALQTNHVVVRLVLLEGLEGTGTHVTDVLTWSVGPSVHERLRQRGSGRR